jgi:hypothetical protein
MGRERRFSWLTRLVALAFLFETDGESRETHLEDNAHHGRTRLIEELTAAWEAQERVEAAASSLYCPLARGLASTVREIIRSRGSDFHAASLDEVLELVPDADAYTYVLADVYAPVSTGATVEHNWRKTHLMGAAWDTFMQMHGWMTLELLQDLDSRPKWTGICFTRDLQELAAVRQHARCEAMLAESGSNIYVLPQLPRLAQVLSFGEGKAGAEGKRG